MNYSRRVLFFILVLVLLAAAPVWAQESALSLRLNRDFGYGGFSGDIQGTFSFRVKGPKTLTEVQFYIDKELVGVDQEAPWRYQFRTDDFALGVHKLYATGRTAGGEVLQSNVLQREFVPAARGWDFVAKVVLPLILLSLLIPLSMFLLGRRRGDRKGAGYGILGGAVCPKCGYPFARHIWAPNMGMSKFDRCPHCGKWSLMRRASPDELADAEERFYGSPETESEPQLSPEEKLRRQIEESRFD